jgi:heme A synthase
MENIERPYMTEGAPYFWLEVFGRLCGGICGLVLLLLSMTVFRPLSLLERRRVREVVGADRR